MEPVRSHRARSVVDAARLHRVKERRERGLTLVEGPQLVADVTSAGAEVTAIFGLEEGPGITLVDQRALERLAGTKSPRGPVAVVKIPTERLDRGRNLLVSAGVSDPGNLGTMVRTAAAFGWGFAYLPGSADPWAPKTIRAGAGGQFQTSVSRIASPDDLLDWVMVATIAHGGHGFDVVTRRPVAVLVGEEASGLDDQLIEKADHRLTIPTPGPTESLNAAVAAAIAIHELSKGSGDPTAGV